MIRTLLAAIAIVSFASVCNADPVPGPRLVIGEILRGGFVQERHLKGMESTLTSRGTFTLVPGSGLIWRTDEPIQSITVITPAAVRQIVNGSEVQRIDTARAPIIAHFYDMLNGALMGDWTTLHHDFAIKTTGNSEQWRTILTPVRSNDPILGMVSSITISGGRMVDKVEIDRTNGDSEQMKFFDQALSKVALDADDARLLAGR